jgi:hypothetical protein
MKPNSSKRAPRRRAGLKTTNRLETCSNVEQRLLEILKNLARILVTSGYGVGGLSRLARRAYFEAALALEDKSGRRMNNARIAALTGLTRSEVSQLSQQRPGSAPRTAAPVNRAQRVSIGWISDSEFCDRQGDPNVLPFAGRRASFEKLVKSYSGDIPARAMLSEMLRLRMAREEGGNTVRLIRVNSPVSNRTAASLRAISPWVDFISEDGNDEKNELNANTVRIELNFDSMPQLFAAIREVQNRATAFVRGVQELGSTGRTAKDCTLKVSIGLATRMSRPENAPKKKKIGTSPEWLKRSQN